MSEKVYAIPEVLEKVSKECANLKAIIFAKDKVHADYLLRALTKQLPTLIYNLAIEFNPQVQTSNDKDVKFTLIDEAKLLEDSLPQFS